VDYDPFQDYIPDGPFKQHEEAIGADRVVVKLAGELDMLLSPSVAGRLHEIAEDGNDVVVDLSDARFIDSTMLEAFVTAQKDLEAHHHALAVVAPGAYARRTFELTGLRDVLRVSGTRDEALTRLGS